MIWEPFLLALILGLLMSAGLYFAYLWPSVEPLGDDEDDGEPAAASAHAATSAGKAPDGGDADPAAAAEDEPARVTT